MRIIRLLTEAFVPSIRELLMRTGSLVKPIMKKHDWKVGTLAEVRSVICHAAELR